MPIFIYLFLTAVGFYFGRWVGALGLPIVFFLLTDKKRPVVTQSLTQTIAMPPFWAYKVLGVTQAADSDTVKKARKKLLNQYHPDKWVQASQAEKQTAEKKVHQINRAYRAIQKYKGFS